MKTVLILLLLTLGIQIAWADSITAITNRDALQANQVIGWDLFGAPYAGVLSGSSIDDGGLALTVTQPFYGFQIRQQDWPGTDLGFSGDFLPGQILLTDWNSPFPVTISFSKPIFGAGLQVEPGQVDDLPAPFTVYLGAYDNGNLIGEFSTTGIKSRAADGSAPFLGVLSKHKEITSLTYRVVTQTNGPTAGDLGMNFLSVRTTPPLSSVPEPPTAAMVLGGLAIISSILGRTQAS